MNIYPSPPRPGPRHLPPLGPGQDIYLLPPGPGMNIYPPPPPRTRSGHLPPPPPGPGQDIYPLPPDQVRTSTPPPGPGQDIYPPWDQVRTSTSSPPWDQVRTSTPSPPRTRSRHLPPPRGPGQDIYPPPPPRRHAGGRYASYWNAFLFDVQRNQNTGLLWLSNYNYVYFKFSMATWFVKTRNRFSKQEYIPMFTAPFLLSTPSSHPHQRPLPRCMLG